MNPFFKETLLKRRKDKEVQRAIQHLKDAGQNIADIDTEYIWKELEKRQIHRLYQEKINSS